MGCLYIDYIKRARNPMLIYHLFRLTLICDMIKGNESLVENFNSYFLAPFSYNFNMLHFDPNLITIGYLVTEL